VEQNEWKQKHQRVAVGPGNAR